MPSPRCTPPCPNAARIARLTLHLQQTLPQHGGIALRTLAEQHREYGADELRACLHELQAQNYVELANWKWRLRERGLAL